MSGLLERMRCSLNREGEWSALSTERLHRAWGAVERTLREGLEAQPQDLALWRQLGLAVDNQGRPSEAQEILTEFLQVYPEDWAGWWHLGVSRYRSDASMRESLEALRAADSRMPATASHRPVLDWFLARAYLSLLAREGLTPAEVDELVGALGRYAQDSDSTGEGEEFARVLRWVRQSRPLPDVRRWIATVPELSSPDGPGSGSPGQAP